MGEEPSYLGAGKVAIVTGAAGAIGGALCAALTARGMRVGMADLPGEALSRAVDAAGEGAVAAPCDIGEPDAPARLCDFAYQRFGRVDLLVNNAVTREGRGHDADLAEWRRAMEVNFWGVVGAVRAFLPRMLAQGAPGAIVHVGSKQGITNPPGHPIYNIAKSALKTYAEALEHDLRTRSDNSGPIRSHLLIPGWTARGDGPKPPGAWAPEQVVGALLDGLAAGRFYILCPDNESTPEMDAARILWGAGDIVEARPPLSRWHADFAEQARKAGC